MTEPPAGRISHRDKEGRPLELLEWAQLYEDFDYRLVAETRVGDQLVRTMWEGIDAGVVGAGDLFHTGYQSNETGNWRDAWAGHHPCTLIEAEAAHELVVAKVREHKPRASDPEK
ncbi:hypothetical protein DMB38_20445 [Streptomyces sp. WAC 06738]|uniref:hypothetical protein n=1 Tax=Streptomyces sp. WAC 06738 TaxID=2203210 RepID=UPI000F6C64A2|nr:hypothetical protein [Streptomyces sp. WAC 06738]AZM47840.1 hypothetical protein DMB38_20445 [Streptomyces sp. WAC 06738]